MKIRVSQSEVDIGSIILTVVELPSHITEENEGKRFISTAWAHFQKTQPVSDSLFGEFLEVNYDCHQVTEDMVDVVV